MTNQVFSTTNIQIDLMVQEIQQGTIRLPDLQRPFVWERARVRDLFDSLYQGYPAGYFLFWRTNSSVDSHGIGSSAATTQGQNRMIVDGQQRLTSVFAVMTGTKVLNEKNQEVQIKLAFNPLTEEFSVANALSDKNPELISNITDIFKPYANHYELIQNYINGLRESRDVGSEQESQIHNVIQRLVQIKHYQFSVLELSSSLDISTVAEIFQRINSKGIPLNSADFILTLMSVYRPSERHKLEDFCRESKHPRTDGAASPYNNFFIPSPDEMLRVAIGFGLKKAVLQHAYQILRGRDPGTQEVTDAYREARFNELEVAQATVLDLTNWHSYLQCLKKAGFRNGRMLVSRNNFLYCYVLFLIGKYEFGVESKQLRNVIARWFFMTNLTGRYTGSTESALDSDLRKIGQMRGRDFVSLLEGIIETQLTSDYWRVSLPSRLDTSSAYHPILFAYHAALCNLDATPLFSDMKISDLLEKDVVSNKSPIERHHLFPKAFLKKAGIVGVYHTNQIANFAFLEWNDNLAISDSGPADYFPEYFNALSPVEKEQQTFWHALPVDWWNLDYDEFLKLRRIKISNVISAGFAKIDSGPVTNQSEVEDQPSVESLLRDMETKRIEFKETARVSIKNDIPEKVINEGVIKTVAAFMNSEGGTLGIGISDDGDVPGIQRDLDYKNQDLDGYQNWMITMLNNAVGSAFVAGLIDIRFEAHNDVVVCLVDVKESSKPVFASSSKGTDLFFVRSGNTTHVLAGEQLQVYIKERFGPL